MATTTAHGVEQGFATLEQEVEIERLPVRGELPPWLAGSLWRNGPARFEHGAQAVDHWFDGLAMLHRFTFADGAVSYANRLLGTRAARRAQQLGRMAYTEFATDPCRSIFQRVTSLFGPPQLTDNANVNLVKLGERFVAMTETPMPVAFDPDTLEALGIAYRPPGHLTTAHPHLDRASGEQINYVTRLGPRATYRVYALAPDGAQRTIATLPAKRPAYMHSFALTERHVVLVEFPLVVRLSRLVLGKPFIASFAWEPARGTTYTVIDRATGAVRGRARGPASFSFHHVNAFDDGERVVVDLCAYEDAAIVRELYLDRLRGQTGRLPDAVLRRCTIDVARGAVATAQLSETPIELPRIDYGAVNGRPHRFADWVVRRAGAPAHEFVDQLVRIDVTDGSARTWREDGCYPGEPVFVPSPRHAGEDDGVCLSVVLDAARGTSFLLVLDAADFGEVARAEVPHHIPFGFHGQFVST